MKKKLPLLLATSLMLVGCVDHTSASSSSNSPSSEETSSQESSSSSNDETLHVQSEMIGTWYISSVMDGLFEINSIFKINADDTLEFGQRTLTLQGHYENYEETYKFVYGTITFIASYDAEHKGIDWGYKNGNDADMGFAQSEPVSDEIKYDYEGTEYPISMIKKYLETSLDIPTPNGSNYRLQLYTSSLYSNAKCAYLGVQGYTTKQTLTYLKSLQGSGYTFYKDLPSKVSNDTFYTCYDESKTYSIRIHHYEKTSSEPEEMSVFIYKYDEKITN